MTMTMSMKTMMVLPHHHHHHHRRRSCTSTTSLVLVACLLLSALIHSSTAISNDDSDSDHAYITCGSAVKIQSTESSYYLNSEKKNLGSGSGQQLVTFIEDASSVNTLWWIRPANHPDSEVEYPAHDTTCRQGKPIKCGTIIRLTHVDTLRNLHSHGVKSVLSQQQEVTGFGVGDGKGDGGDNWKVVCDTEYWSRGINFHLHHQDTNKYLGTAKNLKFDANTCGHNCPIMGHLEAFCRSAKDLYSVMKIEQGVHISK